MKGTLCIVGLLGAVVLGAQFYQTAGHASDCREIDDRMTRMANREADGEYVNQDAALAASMAYTLCHATQDELNKLGK